MPVYVLSEQILCTEMLLKKTPKQLMQTVSASGSQFLPLKAGLKFVLFCNILGMQTGIPLGAQSGGNWVFYTRVT